MCAVREKAAATKAQEAKESTAKPKAESAESQAGAETLQSKLGKMSGTPESAGPEKSRPDNKVQERLILHTIEKTEYERQASCCFWPSRS